MINEESLKSIERLHEMKANGIISEQDFTEAKAKILSQGSRSVAKPVARPQSAERTEIQQHIDWMLIPLRRYAEFEGRSSRREFWMFFLLINLAVAALVMVIIAGGDVISKLSFGLLAIGLLATIVPYVAVQVRRFHDQNKSGWFALLNFVPYIGGFIVLGFMMVQGDAEANEYGPNPKA